MTDTADLPHADTERARPWLSWYLLIPIAALAVGGLLLYQAVAQRGPLITIRFDQGHALTIGDHVEHRGVRVGQIQEVRLTSDMQQVEVIAELKPGAGGFATEGAIFWIVRPEVSLSGVKGLETIIGPRYIAARPGTGGPATDFVGLESEPTREPSRDDLDVILEADRVGSLTVGSPVYYREFKVGEISDVTLTTSGRTIDLIASIHQEHAHLVRQNSTFWNVSGIGVDMGLTGLKVRAESIAALVNGGVAFATPRDPAAIVTDGYRFKLESDGNDSWLRWNPDLTPTGADG